MMISTGTYKVHLPAQAEGDFFSFSHGTGILHE